VLARGTLALVRSVLVSAEAERVAGWVEEHSDMLLRLVPSHRRSEGERLSDRGIEVADLEIEGIIGRCSPPAPAHGQEIA
jgi:hypothetical protein